jgi:hypothetical protein
MEKKPSVSTFVWRLRISTHAIQEKDAVCERA